MGSAITHESTRSLRKMSSLVRKTVPSNPHLASARSGGAVQPPVRRHEHRTSNNWAKVPRQQELIGPGFLALQALRPPRRPLCAILKPALLACTQGPAILAAVVALTSGFLPFTPPPPSHAAQELKGSEKRQAEVARRKAVLAETRAKAEANLMSGKEAMQAKIAAAEAKVDEGNEARRRLAEERSQVVSSQSLQAYDTAAAKAVQVAPPL
ncbi:hypothetical protein V8C86DRAFT_2823228 [Haematococcus lacustris]